jgi:hypothetical protein
MLIEALWRRVVGYITRMLTGEVDRFKWRNGRKCFFWEM